ncbi:hypothetical protein [Flavilitoribacter nigricans]|uniref:Uncharacterized protein n=1 Tax=Flavilitoribacter nigricans (strain ATCC 23147 / DSM 23189 / NBRC 102662 / NCIMB 1420 / SS-2) TaxID=1122177 RepID=A0A2D0MZ94_FLAN2|nr:hypothetical protein [Flavilitoribacter nigricans]PHN01591.1 hypothetical protein CRP01_36440 [Flavilitoribacter nigricans DSM 23189 = NBRC 102662]
MNKKLLFLIPIVALILGLMIHSDIYYSDLKARYPILTENDQIEGTVTDIFSHHKYAFIELDGKTNLMVPPSFLKQSDPEYLHKTIAVGDRFRHESNSNEVSLLRDNDQMSFVVKGFEIR